jgi:molybdate transport system permease protein
MTEGAGEPIPNSASGPARFDDASNPRGSNSKFHVPSSALFIGTLIALGGSYAVLIVLLVLADFGYLFLSGRALDAFIAALESREVRHATVLSLISCSLTTVLSLWVAVPIGYLMSRFEFRGKTVIDTVLDIPIVLPPLVVGISLLVLFNAVPEPISRRVVFEVPAVVIAQFMVACAFAVRTMRVTFDQIPRRYEDVALTLGCSLRQSFWLIVLPQARKGIVAASTLAWARSLGEFGPILVFAGATPLRTEVLPTTVFLEMQAGNLPGMLAVSIIMIILAAIVLIVARVLGAGRLQA